MGAAESEKAWADRVRKFLKVELKRAEVTYEELAQRLKEHGLEETEASIANKLRRGTFAATFFLAAMKAIGRDVVRLDGL